jgi:hypothetical protein
MSFVRSFCLAMAAGAIAEAQTAGPVAAQKAVSEKKFADWTAQNAALEANLKALRACDAQVKETIGDVANASNAWLEAWQRYLEARFQSADAMIADVRSAIATHRAELAEAQAERGEIQFGAANLDVQKAGLAQAPAATLDLREAADILEQLQALTKQRAADKTRRLAGLTAAEDDLRKANLDKSPPPDSAARATELIHAESELWRANYEARWVRAQVDCVTGTQNPARRRR